MYTTEKKKFISYSTSAVHSPFRNSNRAWEKKDFTDLRLSVGPHPIEQLSLSHVREASAQSVRQMSRQRHQRLVLVGRIPKHDPLFSTHM